MTEETAGNAPQETKKVSIAGLTEGLRKKELERLSAKLGRDGWSLREYNEAGMSGSHAIFTRPFTPGAKSKPSSKLWPALGAIAALFVVIALFSGGKENASGTKDSSTTSAPANSNRYAEAMERDLKAFKALDKDDRLKMIGKFVADNNLPADQQTNFYNYVSELVAQKSDSVMLRAALSNAQGEYSSTGGKWSRPHYNLDGFDTQFSGWDGSHHNLERLIKKGLNDEDSYKHIETRYKLVLEGKGAPYLQLFTTIAAKNGFGAVIKKTLGAKATLDGTVIEMDNL